jgi:hypothetical protein
MLNFIPPTETNENNIDESDDDEQLAENNYNSNTS